MQTNPYAPPKSEVSDVVGVGAAPALWNPGAAASWSLLLSPAFGSFLHMKNWQALGEPAKAATAKAWGIASIAVLLCFALVAAFLPESKAVDGLSRIVGIGLLLSWYFSVGKLQVAVVKSRFGKDYPRRGWAKPLLWAFAALLAFIAVVVAVATLAATVAA